MITIFNRKELIVTFSMKQQAKVRDMLNTNKIEYILKTINRNGPSLFSNSRARFGTFGQNMDLAYEYIFYVHKDDYSKAQAIMSGKIK
jgi:hypothetical protein